jgi:hypothetical protein
MRKEGEGKGLRRGQRREIMTASVCVLVVVEETGKKAAHASPAFVFLFF